MDDKRRVDAERIAGVGLSIALVVLLAMSLVKLGMVWFA